MGKILFHTLFLLLFASLSSGEEIQVRINSRLSSESAKPGTPFQGTLVNPVQISGISCAKSSPVGGVVTAAKSSGRLSSPGVLELKPTWVSCRGRRVSVSAEAAALEGKSHTKNNAILIGGGAGAGAILGGLFGGGKGALIGAAAGAGAGTVGAAATGRREAVIEPESIIAWNVQASSNRSVEGTASHRPSRDYRHDRDFDEDRHRQRGDDRDSSRSVRFSDHDRVYLSRCLVSNYRLPPGLAKQGKIPPGHAKKMAAAGYTAIPGACTAELSPIPFGYQRAIIDTRVVLLDAARRIVDSFIWQRM